MKLLAAGILAILSSHASPTLSAQTGPHSAPMQVEYGKPYVMAMVNGRGPFRFLLDTGTGGDAIVTPELASILELPLAGTTQLDDPGGRSGHRASLRLVEKLTVAGIDFYAIRAVEHTLLAADGPCDGMLGFPLFKGLLLTLDYPHGLVTLSDGELEPDGDHTVHAFRMPQGVPISDLVIDGIQVEALLDSGGGGLSFPEQLVSRLHFSSQPTVFAQAMSLSSRFPIKVGRLASNVHLGDFTFDQPWVEINPAFPMANFGAVPMEHFAITFDQENLLVRLDGTRKHINLSITPSPLRLTNEPSIKPADPVLVPVG